MVLSSCCTSGPMCALSQLLQAAMGSWSQSMHAPPHLPEHSGANAPTPVHLHSAQSLSADTHTQKVMHVGLCVPYSPVS